MLILDHLAAQSRATEQDWHWPSVGCLWALFPRVPVPSTPLLSTSDPHADVAVHSWEPWFRDVHGHAIPAWL